jgi:hypothetical protein
MTKLGSYLHRKVETGRIYLNNSEPKALHCKMGWDQLIARTSFVQPGEPHGAPSLFFLHTLISTRSPGRVCFSGLYSAPACLGTNVGHLRAFVDLSNWGLCSGILIEFFQ